MAGNDSLQILRGNFSNIVGNTNTLLDGQLLYSKDTNQLYCGNDESPINTLAPITTDVLKSPYNNSNTYALLGIKPPYSLELDLHTNSSNGNEARNSDRTNIRMDSSGLRLRLKQKEISSDLVMSATEGLSYSNTSGTLLNISYDGVVSIANKRLTIGGQNYDFGYYNPNSGSVLTLQNSNKLSADSLTQWTLPTSGKTLASTDQIPHLHLASWIFSGRGTGNSEAQEDIRIYHLYGGINVPDRPLSFDEWYALLPLNTGTHSLEYNTRMIVNNCWGIRNDLHGTRRALITAVNKTTKTLHGSIIPEAVIIQYMTAVISGGTDNINIVDMYTSAEVQSPWRYLSSSKVVNLFNDIVIF